MAEKREISGVRSAPAHRENPFLESGNVEIKGRRKRYTITSKTDAVVSKAGHVVAGVEHSIVRVVDDSQFVKVFADGVAAIYDLGRPGAKVFRYLFDQVQKHPNIDRIYLYFMDATEEPWSIPKTTFFKGMAELLEKSFIARSANPNIYFLNPAMIWNGDRFRFVQEYRRGKTATQPAQIDQETGEILSKVAA
jgi:hypothetical protein